MKTDVTSATQQKPYLFETALKSMVLRAMDQGYPVEEIEKELILSLKTILSGDFSDLRMKNVH